MSWNDQNWFSPECIIVSTLKLVKEIGINEFFKRKQAVELYATALMTLAVSAKNNEHWWAQTVTDDPPDAKAMIRGSSEKGIHKNIPTIFYQDVEVFRIESFTDEELAEATKRKLSAKAYEKETVLVGFINRPEKIQIHEMPLLREELELINPKISAIYYVGQINLDDLNYYAIQAWPEMEVYRINLKKEFEKLKDQPKCAVVERRTAESDRVVFNDDTIRHILPDESI